MVIMETPDWKVLVALGIAGVAVLSAFFALNPNGGISGFFTAGESAGNVSLTATIFQTPFSVITQASRLTLVLPKFSEGLTISGQKLDLSAFDQVEIVLVGWNGKIDFDKELTLSGTAKSVIVNNIGLSQDGKSQTISGKGIQFNSVKLSSITVQNLKIDEATGKVDFASGKNSIKLDKEPLELSNFDGSIDVKDGIVIEGTSSKILIAGESKISVQ